MLPDGFAWTHRNQYDTQLTALTLHEKQVAFLLERVDGGWVARLWAYQPIPAPVVTRRCTSMETGRAGIEAWACRHESRIRAELAKLIR